MENKKPAKERVLEKFALATDMKESKINVEVSRVKMVDGKISARLEISGLPRKKTKAGDLESYSDSYRSIEKIFDTFEEFANYSKQFFAMSDEDLIALAQK